MLVDDEDNGLVEGMLKHPNMMTRETNLVGMCGVLKQAQNEFLFQLSNNLRVTNGNRDHIIIGKAINRL